MIPATNTCSTNIVRHVNEVYPGRVPRTMAILLPGISPRILKKNNLVKMGASIDESMESSKIDEKAINWNGESDFGDWIRSK